ncbi:MAG: carboxymuconolactone decarboxylase family protein [Mycobacterium sp.]|uniref:carboxymuconolactone decarboxylase family protein n=1 Tax=Mycobacterium sp. TaxID=1785 RepID=UPI003F94ACFB
MSGNLGGRLPLVEADTLDAAQRELFDHLRARVVPWADAAGFRSTTADGRFIGPFNAALRSPAVAGAFLELQASEQRHTSLSDRVRQVVILAVGAAWAADYEIYAHSAVARHSGIPDDAVRRLAAGSLPDTLSDEEKVAYRFAQKLSTTHRIDDSTFNQARKAFGDNGIVDIIILAGTYYTVCGLLNAFEVPAPSETPS